MHKFGVGDFVIDGERLVRGVGIGRVDAAHLPAEAVREREKLGEVLPFFLRCLMKRDAEEQFVIAAQGVMHFSVEISVGTEQAVQIYLLGSMKGKTAFNFLPTR